MDKQDPQDLTKRELLDMARRHDVPGRSGMSKEELVAALRGVRGDHRPVDAGSKPRESATDELDDGDDGDVWNRASGKDPNYGRFLSSQGGARPDRFRPGGTGDGRGSMGRGRDASGQGATRPEGWSSNGRRSNGRGGNGRGGNGRGGDSRGANSRGTNDRGSTRAANGRGASGRDEHRRESLAERSERGRSRASAKSQQARDALRRTGDARRGVSYVPRYERDREPRHGDSGDSRRGGRRGSQRRGRWNDRDDRESRDFRRRDDGGRRGPANPRVPLEGSFRKDTQEQRSAEQPSATPVSGRPSSSGLDNLGVVGPVHDVKKEMASLAAEAPGVNLERRSSKGEALHFPEEYELDRCRVMARDPYWIHAYWDLSPATLERLYEEVRVDPSEWRIVLRVHSHPMESAFAGAQPAGFFDVEVGDSARSWYVHVGIPQRMYRVEVGIGMPDGSFHSLVHSNKVVTPPDRMSDEADPRWSTPMAEARRLYEFSGGSPVRNIATGPSVPGGEDADPPPRPRETGRPEGHLGGSESEWQGPKAWGSSPTQPSSANPGAEENSTDFRFHLHTELLLSGVAEPGTEIQIQGVPVRMREDGSFLVKLQLPDGEHEIPVEAVSPDRSQEIRVVPKIVRHTQIEKRDKRNS